MLLNVSAANGITEREVIYKLKFTLSPHKETKTVGQFRKSLQDKKGNIWVGTWGKLLKYDGYQFTSYRKESADFTKHLVDEAVTTMAVDVDDSLWLGGAYALTQLKNDQFFPIVRTDKRASKYLGNDKLVRERGGLPPEQVSSILILNKDEMWLGMRESLVAFDRKNNTFTNYSPWSKIPSGQKTGLQLKNVAIEHLIEGENNTFWLGTVLRGLIKFDRNTKSAIVYEGQVSYGISFTKISGIHKIDNEELILATNDGLIRFNTSSESFARYPENNPIKEPITSIFTTKSGELWAGGNNVYQITPDEKVIKYDQLKDFSITDKSVTVGSIFVDEQESVYVFYDHVGMFKASPYASKIRLINDLPETDNNVKVLVLDGNSFWAGYSQGLIKATPTNQGVNYTAISKKQGTPFLDIRDIHIGKDNKVWVAEKNKITSIVDGKVTQEFIIPDDITKGKYVHSLVEDYNGHIWFTVRRNGIFVLSPEDQSIRREDALKEQDLPLWYHLKLFASKDRKQITYFKSSDGLGKFDIENSVLSKVYKQRQRQFPYEFELPWRESAVWHFYSQADKPIIWATHVEKYVSWFDLSSDTGETINVPTDEPIFSIASNDNNIFWLGGENGSISKWNKDSNHLVTYDTEDGLPQRGVSGSSIVLKDGTAIFGGRDGLAFISKNTIKQNPHKFETKISSIKINYQHNRLAEAVEPLQLKHFENIIEFAFRSTSTASSESNKYRYRLIGLYDEWRETVNNERKIAFNNLSPGSYIFQVQSTNNDLKWETVGATVNFEILPAWYASKLAYTVYVVFIILISFLVHKIRIRVIEAKANALENLVTERTSKLNAALEFKNKFIYVFAHELKTMLQIQAGVFETLSRFLGNNSGAKVELLETSNKNVSRTIEQLLKLAQLQNRGERKNEVFNAAFIVQLLLPYYEHFANDEFKVKLYSEISSNELFIAAEKESFELILSNLIVNAIKYNRKEGSVKVKVGTDGENVIFEITDTGNGIPKNKVPESIKYTGPKDIKPTSNQHYASSGLGLNIVLDLVESNGGTISVKSELGIGSCFTVSFPVASSVSLDAEQLSQSSMKMISMETSLLNNLSISDLKATLTFDENRSTVLLIDDNKQLLQSLAPPLNERFNLILAEDGEEGLTKALSYCPDLILTDLNMPKMDGLEVLKQVKNNSSLGHIPVIILTAVANEDTQIHGLSLGAEDVIIKPVNPSDIAHKISNRLETNRALWKRFSYNGVSEEKRQPVKTDIHNPTPQQKEEENCDKWLSDLHDYINANLASPKKQELPVVADHMNVSVKFLAAKIYQLTDVKGVAKYIREYRLKLGRQKLLEGWDDKIIVLAMSLGFSDTNFSNKYQEMFGESPSTTQKRVREGKQKAY